VGEVEPAVGGEVHLDHRGQPLAPGDLVRVVLVGPDEHDGLPLAEGGERLALVHPEEPDQEVAGGRGERDAEDLLEPVDRARRAGPAADEPAVRPGVDELP
jgi:hypothetical protein